MVPSPDELISCSRVTEPWPISVASLKVSKIWEEVQAREMVLAADYMKMISNAIYILYDSKVHWRSGSRSHPESRRRRPRRGYYTSQGYCDRN